MIEIIDVFLDAFIHLVEPRLLGVGSFLIHVNIVPARVEPE